MAQKKQTGNSPVPSADLIKKLPKVELHRHLEGSFRLETLMEFASNRGLTELPLGNADAFRPLVQMTEQDTPDFLTFLSKFRAADFYTKIDDPHRLAYEAVEDAAKENIKYFEIRFSPEHYGRTTGFKPEAVIESVISGAEEAASKYGIDIAYLITVGREKLDVSQMKQYIQLCLPYRDHGIVGIDLAGDEIHYPPELFSSVFKGLYEKTGLYATIHAGEAGPADNVRTSIIELDAKRIGHGVHAIDDPAVMDLAISKAISFEQCLTSNIQTGTVNSIKEHPFPDFFKSGVLVTLNSDDPQIQQADLNDDYMLAVDNFGFSLEQLKQVNIYSLESAFQSPERKAQLIKSFSAEFDRIVSES